MSFVVDASVVLFWCFEDAANAYSDAVLDRLPLETAVAPAIWPLEIANVLLVGERRDRLTEAETAAFLKVLGDLPIAVDDRAVSGAWDAVLALARSHGLSVDHAAYVELAERQGLQLATLDARLRRAAGRAGVAILEPIPDGSGRGPRDEAAAGQAEEPRHRDPANDRPSAEP